MPQVIQDGSKWIIATNFRMLNSVSKATGKTQTRETFDVWDGNRWWTQIALAMKFDTHSDAEARLALDRWQM